jgi:outer membrane protein assembly factor BamB
VFLAVVIATPGCSWFRREQSAVDVSELVELANPRAVEVGWNQNSGKGADDHGVTLVASLDGSTVYVAHHNGIINSFNTQTGANLWTQDVDADLGGGPGVGNGLVIVGTTEGEVMALNQTNGSEVWRSRVSSDIPSVPASGNGIVAVHTNDGKIFGLDAVSGEQRWMFHRTPPVLSLRGTASPVIEGTDLYTGLDGGKLVKLKTSNGLPQWESPIAYPSGRNELEQIVDIDGALVLSASSIYVTTYQGEIAAVNKVDGKVKWRLPFSSHQGVISDGFQLYSSDSNGHVSAFNSANGTRIWEQKALSGRQLSTAVIAGGLIAVGDLEGYVHFLSPDSGEIIARTRAVKSAIRAPLVAQGNTVFAYGLEGELAAVRVP